MGWRLTKLVLLISNAYSFYLRSEFINAFDGFVLIRESGIKKKFVCSRTNISDFVQGSLFVCNYFFLARKRLKSQS